jgi:magnesium-transporting ATPase (P-type)
VMAGCHALATINNDLVGDPVEIAAIKHISWTLGTGETSVSTKRSQRLVIRMRHRFHFQSALKRMSTIVSLDHNEQVRFYLKFVEGFIGIFTF